MNAELRSKYREMRKKRGPAYQPRTHHLDAEGWARYTNRLFLETSPYLLQHAHNPVDWYPWGEEAFKKARAENLPIMVSIGYATCHWCHVMEAESFEDEEISRIINANFVPIKIDREERPDVDSIYMQAVQAMGLGGGWPLNVWLTPDLKPFFGGTYFPARDGDRPGATGFLTVLKSLKDYYDNNRGKVAETVRAITTSLNQNPAAFAEMLLAVDTYLDEAVEVVIASESGSEGVSGDLLVPLRETFLPSRVMFAGGPDEIEQGARTLPFLKDKTVLDGKTAVFVCDRRGCRQPVSGAAGVRAEINRPVLFKRQG